MSLTLRHAGILATAAVASLALAACTPPNENPSTERVATATEFEAPTPATTSARTTSSSAAPTSATAAVTAAADSPTFINCLALPARTPDTVSLTCLDNSDQLTDIEWTEWGANGATGTGTRVTDGREVGEAEIELSEPFDTGNGEIFSVIVVDGEEILL